MNLSSLFSNNNTTGKILMPYLPNNKIINNGKCIYVREIFQLQGFFVMNIWRIKDEY